MLNSYGFSSPLSWVVQSPFLLQEQLALEVHFSSDTRIFLLHSLTLLWFD